MRDPFPDLSARARRHALPEPEQRQLRLLLAGSLEARLAHRAGCEFDDEDCVLPGDDALAARVTARLLSPTRPTTAIRRRLAWRLVPAAALAVAAAAAGPTLVERLGESPALVSGRVVVEAPRGPTRAPHLGRGTAMATQPADSTPLGSSSVPAPSAAPQPPTPAKAGAATSDSAEEGPAELFAAASRARREGHTVLALALYQQLERRHPTTAEAHAADIALGVLHAEAAPAVALAHFRRYLAHGGPLAPEALWGQARALSALGRTEEARESWRTLITRYPRSTYANAARTRLASDP